ncbi:hypothetical protein [Parvibaculum sp.]|uniref:hypothetical protein n=1 Tax=Parvibaculum sp. TaxID=2024848 RepID=UPI00273566BD|nr:hypothetical protein [Parvibaculum sp.]MDP3327168.1 hypothetical protein [Parvibaculum sp.]
MSNRLDRRRHAAINRKDKHVAPMNGVKPKLNPLDPIAPIVSWLHSPSPYKEAIGEGGPNVGVVPVKEGWTHLRVLAELVARNGFTAKVVGWGAYSGPLGLTQKDAFLLMELGPYLQGMMDFGRIDSQALLSEYLQPELTSIAASWNMVADDLEHEADAGAADVAHASDCAEHAEPAAPAGDCDCGHAHGDNVDAEPTHDPLNRDKGETDGA